MLARLQPVEQTMFCAGPQQTSACPNLQPKGKSEEPQNWRKHMVVHNLPLGLVDAECTM